MDTSKPIVVDFTSKLVQWRMRRGAVYDDDPELCAAYRRWRADRLAALPQDPPVLDPAAGVDPDAFAHAAAAVGLPVPELGSRLWRDDTTPGLAPGETILAQLDGDTWSEEEWAAVQAYRRWLLGVRETWLSAADRDT